jgi:hypothetical protein
MEGSFYTYCPIFLSFLPKHLGTFLTLWGPTGHKKNLVVFIVPLETEKVDVGECCIRI